MKDGRRRPYIGVALGSGSARGWAHIGVFRALREAGLRPDIVAGSSVGAIVGAMYAMNRLRVFEHWVRSLGRRGVLGYLDLTVRGGGGFFEGQRLRQRFVDAFGDVCFDALRHPLGVVATELGTGHERWLREGSVVDAIRASIALPGLFTPVLWDGEWLVDGGLVNPVPISLCHAMGADLVIAVNLNGGIVGRHHRLPVAQPDADPLRPPWLDRLASGLFSGARQGRELAVPPPGLFEVMATAINIMQDRITRSRMAGDPPDLMISPRLGDIGLLEFDRAEDAIEEGYQAVRRQKAAIGEFMERASASRAENR